MTAAPPAQRPNTTRSGSSSTSSTHHGWTMGPGQRRQRWNWTTIHRVSTDKLATQTQPQHHPLLLPGTHHSPLHRTTQLPRPTTYLRTNGTAAKNPTTRPDA